MIDVVTTIVYFIVALTILVAVHEYGHFFVARRCGVRVLRFSIGFGSRLLRWHDKHGTEYAISAIPLGGYVKMLDEREGNVAEADLPFAFTRKPVWQRIAIASAGPAANFLLAIVLYWLIFLQGTVSFAPVIGKVEPGSIAAEAGLEAGQEIVAVDGKTVDSRRAFELLLISRLGESGDIDFTVQYPGSDLVYESTAKLDHWLQGEEGPDLLKGLGLSFYYPPVLLTVGSVNPDSPAQRGGLLPGDKIVAIDDEYRASGDEWSSVIREQANVELEFRVERLAASGEVLEHNLYITPALVKLDNGKTRGLAGFSWNVEPWPEAMKRIHHYGVVGSMVEAVAETRDASLTVLISVKKLILGQISTKNLSGPIGIAKVAGDSAKAGIWPFLRFLAYVSVLLGVFNLLPVPVLDGGHILYGLIEWVKGSPVSERVQILGYKAGLAMLLGLMVIAFYNDILRL